MLAPLDCPNMDCWQNLFRDALPAEERDHYERHLESCASCQARVEGSEEFVESVRSRALRVGDPTNARPAPGLTQALEGLHGIKSPLHVTGTADLFFLRPTDQPAFLGMLGNYAVEEVIGQGGMGIVLKAHEPALERTVAIKVLSPALAGSATARQRFKREAKATAAIDHHHVVKVHAVSEESGLPYLVMQYVRGDSLQDRLDRSGPLEVVEIVLIGLQTALGLAAAHAQGLIHRDIKPANILLQIADCRLRIDRQADASSDQSAIRNPQSAIAKITDFGLARMVDDVGLTQNGVVAGTPEYMAPEQARGESVDHRADLFSLGSVLYAMCTGASPFHGPTALAVVRRVSEEEPEPLRSLNPDVPAWLETLIVRLLAKNPAERFQSAAEVATLLEGYLAHLRQPMVPAPLLPGTVANPSSVSPPGSRRVRLLWLVAIVFVAGLGLALALLAQNPPPAENARQKEFYQDFRANSPWSPLLAWSGRDGDEEIEPDDRGLRVKLSPNRKNKFPCGVQLTSSVKGDFEVTAAYEIIHADQPRRGFGVGFELYLPLQSPDREALTFIRVKRVDGSDIYGPNRIIDLNGKRNHSFRPFPVERSRVGAAAGPGPVSMSGQLRITRIGTEAAFWVAEGAAGEFRKLHQCRAGAGDLETVRVAACPGGASEPVEVRFVDLRVRAQSVEGGQDVDASGVAASGTGENNWLYAGLVVGGVICVLSVVCVWLASRQRGKASKTTASCSDDKQAQAGAVVPPILITCPGCGKTLKARTEFAGKRVKCPQCGQPVSIPGASAIKASS